MFLHDHARRACRKGIAPTRQIGAGNRLADSPSLRRNRQILRIDILPVRRRAGRSRRPRPIHPKHRQHIAHAIRNSNHRRQAPRLRLRRRMGNHRLDIGNRQRLLRRIGIEPRRRGRRSRRGRSPAAATPAATAAGRQHQRRQRNQRAKFVPQRPHRKAPMLRAALPSAALNAAG